MSRRDGRPGRVGRSGRAAQPGTVVLLCRGCCCGTAAKHPRVDHDGQQLALEDAAESHPGVALRIVDCLDECDRSNVAVLRRPAAPRARRRPRAAAMGKGDLPRHLPLSS